MKELQLLQLNVEQSKHTERIIPFLKTNTPDVLCLQEVTELDVEALCTAAGTPFSHIEPILLRDGKQEGLLLASRYPLRNLKSYCYAGTGKVLEHIKGSPLPKDGEFSRIALFGTITVDGTDMRIGVTHFTWTPRGEASDAQRDSMRKLLAALKEEAGFVLCGDFNAPRKNPDGTPGEIFLLLSSTYMDNIPSHYETSIDVTLHRSGHLPEEHMDKKMVDGIFSTPDYAVTNVERVCGLSDHCGFTAIVSKNNDTAQ